MREQALRPTASSSRGAVVSPMDSAVGAAVVPCWPFFLLLGAGRTCWWTRITDTTTWEFPKRVAAWDMPSSGSGSRSSASGRFWHRTDPALSVLGAFAALGCRGSTCMCEVSLAKLEDAVTKQCPLKPLGNAKGVHHLVPQVFVAADRSYDVLVGCSASVML